MPTSPAIKHIRRKEKSLTRTKLATISKYSLAAFWLVLVTATHVPLMAELPPIETSDKVLHASAYLILAFLLASAWELNAGRLNARHLTVAWLAVIVWAAIDEITQIPVGRDADFWDWLADASGAAVGIVLFVVVRRMMERRTESR